MEISYEKNKIKSKPMIQEQQKYVQGSAIKNSIAK